MYDNYIVYHLHDDHSNCNGYYDSCTSYKDYIKLAKKNNMPAIAFSNHGGIYDWVKKKQDCEKANIKYIHGIETYLCVNFQDDDRGSHIGLYAKNFDGVLELNQLISNATLKGSKDDKSDRHYYYNPRISLEELTNTSDNIIVTTACLASPLWKWKKDERSHYQNALKILIDFLHQNKHRCFLEIQYHSNIDQIEYNKWLYSLSLKHNIPLIAGTDTHSSSKYKAECKKILQKSNGSFYGDEDSFDLTWKTYDELVDDFQRQNALNEDVYLEAINNTNVFNEMIDDFTLDTSLKYPTLYKERASDLLKNKIVQKFNEKVANGIISGNLKQYKTNIKEEFLAFKNQKMESFILFFSELIDYCNKNDIPYGFCRGSIGGSLIAYILDITDVNPIIWNTIFSRFCNADRISLADIDVDFKPSDRAKVFEYIINKFSIEKTSYIAQFGTCKDRKTIEVLARGLEYKDLDFVASIKNEFETLFNEYVKIIQAEVNLEEVDYEYKNVDFDNYDYYKTIIRNQSAIHKANKLKTAFEELKKSNRDLFYYFDGIKGTIISKGHHPAGMIGSPVTLQDNLGVFFQNGDSNFPVSTCAMKAVDSLNYVKFDILGLKTVGIIKDTFDYINSPYLKSHEINWSDENVWDEMLTSRIGIFQFQGEYAHDLLKRFQPHKINDMSLVNASLRPSGKSYRDKLINKEPNINPSKEIDELLKDNYNYLVYQEDCIKFLVDICGFSGSLADTTRRCIGKKDIEGLKQQLPKIIEGYCKTSTKPYEVAKEEVMQFIQIISDSSEYQFGYNHSTGYSMNGYLCALLRHYYPLEFTVAYLNNADCQEDIDMGSELAKLKGFEIQNITFGKSTSKYSFDKSTNTIYKSIGSIKFCNNKIAEELNQVYERYTNEVENRDFIFILDKIKQETSIDTRQLEILTILNYFSTFGQNQMLLDIINVYLNIFSRKQINKNDIQKLNINEELLQKHSNKTTHKLYKEIDTIGYLQELIQTIPNKPIPIRKQIDAEIEYLGDVVYTNSSISDDIYYVKEFKTYKDLTKPYLVLYNIKNGNNIKVKVKNGTLFSRNKFNQKSIIKIIVIADEFKSQLINGEWMKSQETERILKDWEVIG